MNFLLDIGCAVSASAEPAWPHQRPPPPSPLHLVTLYYRTLPNPGLTLYFLAFFFFFLILLPLQVVEAVLLQIDPSSAFTSPPHNLFRSLQTTLPQVLCAFTLGLFQSLIPYRNQLPKVSLLNSYKPQVHTSYFSRFAPRPRPLLILRDCWILALTFLT